MKKNAFTLAEVLITLTIIGVIAALTIPNLIKKWEDLHTVSAVKEAYSIIDNAIKLAVRENGELSDWNWSGGRTDYFAQQLLPYFKNATYCGIPNNTRNFSCVSYQRFINGSGYYYVNLNGAKTGTGIYNVAGTASIRLGNGMFLMILNVFASENKRDGTFGSVIVDINGKKGPNRWGYDAFLFGFGNKGLIINSELSESQSWAYVRSNCQNPTSSAGTSCGRYIMRFGDTDYKYKDVSNKWPTVAWW